MKSFVLVYFQRVINKTSSLLIAWKKRDVSTQKIIPPYHKSVRRELLILRISYTFFSITIVTSQSSII